jgi:hypothetical protein
MVDEYYSMAWWMSTRTQRRSSKNDDYRIKDEFCNKKDEAYTMDD